MKKIRSVEGEAINDSELMPYVILKILFGFVIFGVLCAVQLGVGYILQLLEASHINELTLRVLEGFEFVFLYSELLLIVMYLIREIYEAFVHIILKKN